MPACTWREKKESGHCPQRRHVVVGGAGVASLDGRSDLSTLSGVVFVSATFCKACRRIEPHYARVARGARGRFAFYKVDATRDRKIAKTLGVGKAPAFAVVDNGAVTSAFSTTSPTELRDWLASAGVA